MLRPVLSLAQARAQRRCRICGEPIAVQGCPAGWTEDFGSMVYPLRLSLAFGAEFAHTSCLEQSIRIVEVMPP